MKLFEIFRSMFSGVTLNEMAWANSASTGLDTPVWFGKVGGRHGPRIKVSNIVNKGNNSDSFVVTISPNPIRVEGTIKISNESLEKVYDWVRLNYDILIKMYKAIEVGSNTIIINHKAYDIEYALKHVTRKLK